MRATFLCLLALSVPATAAAQRATMTEADCQRFVAHEPSPDVAYRPGVDVQGRPVAPADLPGSVQVRLPDTFTIDLAVDLHRYGLPANSPLFEPNARVGRIAITADGRAYLDGQPLQSQESAALREYCRQRAQPRR